MKYFSTFSGIGGFEIGITKAYENHNKQISSIKQNKKRGDRKTDKRQDLLYNRQLSSLCVGYSEIDEYAVQVYNKQFNHKQYGDITKIVTSKLPDFDLLVGGFPCQSFSIAGKRKGFDDTRGTLFFNLARILRDKRPRYFVFENVKGLLSHDSGKTFQTILGVLTDLGYRIEWQVLNSKNFGVPQNRERVFIVGHLREKGGRKVFPIGEDDKISSESNEARKTQSQTSIASTIKTKKGTRSDDNFIIINKKGNKKKSKNCAACLTGGGHSGGNHSDMDLMLSRDNRSCLRAGRTLELGIKGHSIRRLTPKECERLQGFPDNFSKYGINEKGETIKISDSQRYCQCGNAVTVNVVQAIISKLINQLS